jgi:2-C-methyl-D-erythritol 4-phosphate cytidylyltransferase
VDAVGVVPTEGRGSLPFLLYDAEPLVSIATAALASAEVELLDFTASWSDVQQRELPLVVHDPLCPGTPRAFLRSMVVDSPPDAVSVAVHPVTDTVKTSTDGVLGETVDRSGLVAVVSPVVLPVSVVAALTDWPDLDDLAVLVDRLRDEFEVRLVDAPAGARRITDESDLAVLDGLSGV